MNDNERQILVVGGTGVISFAVVTEALKHGFKVVCINRGKSKAQALDPSVEVILSDYRDRQKIEDAIKDRHFELVIDVLCYNESDIEYSVSLFGNHCNQYIFFSSAEVYNKPLYEQAVCNENADMPNPNWTYSIGKANCEKKLMELAPNFGFKYTIIRPAITYGNTRIPYGFMPPYGYHGTIIQRILNHKPLILFNDGKNYAAITRVEDFAIGLVGLIGNPKAFNQAFHIVGEESYTWKEVLDTLGLVLGVTPIYVSADSQLIGQEMPNLREQIIGGRSYSQKLDNSKLKNAVPEFKTTITLKKGLEMTVDYYRSHQYINGMDFSFDAAMDRIITKHCKSKGVDTKQYNLGFVDYLGNASINDRLTYWMEYRNNNVVGKILRKCISLAKSI